MTVKKHQPLGQTQKDLLNCLGERGSWHPGCGWIWSNPSTTTRILNSLVRRGLVSVETVRGQKIYGDYQKFRLTRRGVADMLQHQFNDRPLLRGLTPKQWAEYRKKAFHRAGLSYAGIDPTSAK